MPSSKVVILGAGFGGLELATMLSEGAGTDIAVTLIDKSDAFVFGYSKLDVMFGRTTLDAVRLPYRDLAKPGVRFLQRDGHRDRSGGAARHAPMPASTRRTSSSSRSAPTTTWTRRPGSPRRGNEFYSVAGAERLARAAARRSRAAGRSSASAGRRSSARRRRARPRCCCTTTCRRAASAATARSRS